MRSAGPGIPPSSRLRGQTAAFTTPRITALVLPLCLLGAAPISAHAGELRDLNGIETLKAQFDHAAWFNVLARDRRSGWSPDRFNDHRVLEFWDADRTLSRWYKDHLPGHGRTIAWDLYALYGPDARWEAAPGKLVNWGRAVYSKREQLAAEVDSLLGRR